jgi:tRNA-dihydrouridine synthase 2
MVFEEPGLRCLAPMVRINTLPMRLLALEYGADVVYSEELVARSLCSTTRRANPTLGTTDWVRNTGGSGAERLILRIAPQERSKLVLQLGAAEAAPALEAASHVAQHVAAIDLNMGCPMHFSTSGGMGAALLREPERAADILGTLRRNLSVPVTAKIRLLGSAAESVELARRLEACGIAALAVHCREVHHRSRTQPALWEGLPPIVDALSIPVVANGDIFCYEDFERARAATGCHSAMAARGALWNCSIFRKGGPADLLGEVIPRYVALAAEYDTHPGNTKSVLQDMLERKGGKASVIAAAASGDRGDGDNQRPYARCDDGTIAVDEERVRELLAQREVSPPAPTDTRPLPHHPRSGRREG